MEIELWEGNADIKLDKSTGPNAIFECFSKQGRRLLGFLGRIFSSLIVSENVQEKLRRSNAVPSSDTVQQTGEECCLICTHSNKPYIRCLL